VAVVALGLEKQQVKVADQEAAGEDRQVLTELVELV
jgi:hypothetical protein